MSKTPNYDLYVTDDSSTKFKEWREQIASEANSNMTKIDVALSEKADSSKAITITLSAANWVGEKAPYTMELQIEDITAESNGSLSIASSADASQRAAARKAQISLIKQVNGALTLSCDGKKPAVDIPAVVIILG